MLINVALSNWSESSLNAMLLYCSYCFTEYDHIESILVNIINAYVLLVLEEMIFLLDVLVVIS